jgi:hypothetical protein
MLAEQARKVSVGSETQLQRGMEPRRDKLQAKYQEGKNEAEMFRAARS